MTQHAAMEYASSNIRVNCLCPGPFETPSFAQLEKKVGVTRRSMSIRPDDRSSNAPFT